VTLAPLAVAAVLLPLFVVIERRAAAPMLDLTLFHERSFNAATAAAFLSGLSRFALTFVFVLYFQGAQGDDPIVAGVKLAPLAAGMLVSSPLAGRYADRHGARSLAALGLLVTAAGMIAMTTLQVDTPYRLTALWLLIAGVGSGMFNSPNTSAMMGAVPAHRRGIAGGTRMMLQNTGSVLSIAILMAIVTAGVPKSTLLSIFSGLTTGLAPDALEAFIHNLHVALWVLAASSVAAAGVSLLRPTGKTGAAPAAEAARA
jgi:MFS family permease